MKQTTQNQQKAACYVQPFCRNQTFLKLFLQFHGPHSILERFGVGRPMYLHKMSLKSVRHWWLDMPISLCRRIIFFCWCSVYRSRYRFTRRKEQDRDPFPSSNTHLAKTSKLSEDGILPAACSLGLGSHFLTHSPNMKWGDAAPSAPYQSGQGPVPCHAFCFIWARKQSHSRCFDCI